jgi:hypothetical protein
MERSVSARLLGKGKTALNMAEQWLVFFKPQERFFVSGFVVLVKAYAIEKTASTSAKPKANAKADGETPNVMPPADLYICPREADFYIIQLDNAPENRFFFLYI